MGAFDKFIAASARKHGVSEEYLRKLIQYESRGDPNAVSPTGVRGIAQITSETGRGLGLNRRNFTDPAAQIDAAAQLAKKNQGQLTRALGRPPTDDELYLGHLQGAGGASASFKNPNARAIDILDPDAVKANLPREYRSRLNTITAKEYQDIHRANFNRSPGTIDITDQPSLKTLNPPSPKGDRLDKQPTIPLSQLAPTEQSTPMARYPSYDQAVAEAINQVNGGRGGVQYAGLVLPAIRGPGGRMRANPLKTPNVQKGLPSPEQVPGARTPSAQEEVENARKAYERQMELRAKADRVRRGEPAEVQGPQQSAPIAGGSSQLTPPPPPGSTAPIQPRGVPTQRITRDQATGAATVGGAAAVGAAAGDAASRRSDPAVDAVQQSIQGAPDPNLAVQNDPARQAAIAARIAGRPSGQIPAQRGPGASVQSEASSPAANSIMAQAAPMIQKVMSDPEGRQAVQTIVRKVAETHGQQADMQNDPTYYQMMASRGQMPGGMQDDRAMERAVMMDNQRRMQGGAPSARGVPAARGRPQVDVGEAQYTKDQSQVPQEKGDTRGLPPEVAQQFPVPPTPANIPTPVPQGYPQVPPLPSRVPTQRIQPGGPLPNGRPGAAQPWPYQTPPSPEATNPSGQMQQPQMDPAMMQLMSFFTGGGNVG